MNLGPHADFILAAYALGTAIIAALAGWVTYDYRQQQRILADLEARGVTRRSQRSNADTP
jgi:heme exporter protein D